MTLTFSPEASTWSKPPKPMSYAHPSPPKIHTDFLGRYAFFSRIGFTQSHLTFSSSATNASAAGLLVSVLSFVSMNLANASLRPALALSLSAISLIDSIRLSRMYFWPLYRPRPCSALSSNNEFAHAGPFLEFLLIVYGAVAAGPPQIEEQPVAFEMYMCSPKSCVIRRA